MSATTKIQWADKSWNPVRGCSIVSPGCVNCYAMKQAHRFSGEGKAYFGLTKQTKAGPQWTGKIQLVEDALLEPLSWRKPQRVFVNSMSDLFHEDVPFEFIDRVFAVMALAPRHTFQILTKRADRMRIYVGLSSRASLVANVIGFRHGEAAVARALIGQDGSGIACDPRWPLPNVWLGVSCEDQPRADERIPQLLQTPAAVRFISYEPALGPLKLERPDDGSSVLSCTSKITADEYERMTDAEQLESEFGNCCERSSAFGEHFRGIDWVIVGGESGPGARPCDLAWVRSIVAQCEAAGTAVFVKQLGAKPESIYDRISFKGSTTPKPDGFYRHLNDRKGGDIDEFPPDLRVREFPEVRT